MQLYHVYIPYMKLTNTSVATCQSQGGQYNEINVCILYIQCLPTDCQVWYPRTAQLLMTVKCVVSRHINAINDKRLVTVFIFTKILLICVKVITQILIFNDLIDVITPDPHWWIVRLNITIKCKCCRRLLSQYLVWYIVYRSKYPDKQILNLSTATVWYYFQVNM